MKLFSISIAFILLSINAVSQDRKEIQGGFFSEVTQNDTVYFALITSELTGEDLDVLQENVHSYGAELNIFDLRLNNHNLDYIGIEFISPDFPERKGEFPLIRENRIVGAYYNRAYPSPFDLGVLDEAYLTDYTDINNVLERFGDLSKIRITLNGAVLAPEDYEALRNYKLFEPSDIRQLSSINNKAEQTLIIQTK